MDPAWIAVIGTLLGGLLVGTISIVLKIVELRYQREREDRLFLRAKIEELHDCVANYRSDSLDYITGVLRLTLEPALDETTRLNAIQAMVTAVKAPLGKITSMQLLHAKEMAPEWQSVLLASSGLVQMGSLVYEGRADVERFKAASEFLQNTCNDFLVKLEEKYASI